jgi:hypothetical protein
VSMQGHNKFAIEDVMNASYEVGGMRVKNSIIYCNLH